MANILIVCTANICRSPVATALLRDRLRRRGLSDWVVDSAGTWAMVSRGASRNSIVVTEKNGLDITNHRAKMIERIHMHKADLILTMEVGHAEALRAEFPEHAHKVYMLTEMIGQNYSVADPYGGPLPEYEKMYVALSQIIDEGLNRIVYQAHENAKVRG